MSYGTSVTNIKNLGPGREKGFWVNGTFDSIGENQDQAIGFLSKNKNWLKLTHEDSSEFFIKEKLSTYKLIKGEIKEDLSKKTHFYLRVIPKMMVKNG